jgi:hypothetical protein
MLQGLEEGEQGRYLFPLLSYTFTFTYSVCKMNVDPRRSFLWL